jgi:hypothetical protein
MDWHWTEPGPQRREAGDWPTELPEGAHRKLENNMVEKKLKETLKKQMNDIKSAKMKPAYNVALQHQ